MIPLSKAKYLRVNSELEDFKVVHVSVLQCCLQSGKEQRASLPGERMEQCFFQRPCRIILGSENMSHVLHLVWSAFVTSIFFGQQFGRKLSFEV